METLEKLLNNPLVMIPLVGVIAALLDALRDWIKRKWPRGSEAVERYWDYLRPEVDRMLSELAEGKGSASAVARALAAFCDTYRRYERTETVPDSVILAVQAELEGAAEGAGK